jgi:sugar-specific transcriptional regulator TrmB
MEKTENEAITRLTDFGLSEKEAAVYVATLELGHGTVSQISRKAGINRTTGYDILSSLASQELVRVSGKEPKQEYVAESPNNLLKMLNKKREYLNAEIHKIDEKTQKAEAFVPVLKTIHKVESRPRVKFYEGVEGIKQVYEDTLTSTEQILVYATVEDAHEGLKGYFPKYYQRRAASGVSVRGITPRTPMALERSAHNQDEKREMIMVPADKYRSSPDIEIYDNKVTIASWREQLGIIIESAEIADAMKKLFELAWIGAKSLSRVAEEKPDSGSTIPSPSQN